jgi:transcriptional regulator with XRE-family HTH domain
MDDDEKLPPCPTHDQAVEQFKTALRRLTSYGGNSRDGEPARTTRASLSRHSNVAPATLSTYLTPLESTDGRKPGLDKLCRLAEALGLPPALLLMTADDWSRLLAAVRTYTEMAAGPRGAEFMDFQQQTVANPQYRGHSREVVRDATRMAEIMFGQVPASEHLSSIVANSVAMPLSRIERGDDRGLALAIAVHFGTSAKQSKFMGEQVEQDSRNGAD